MGVAALVLAAGRGERLGSSLPKAFVALAGKPLIVRSLDALAAVPGVERLVPVVPAEALARFERLPLAALRGLAPPVVGGAERQDSMAAGLAALPESVSWVAVHDAARCLVSPDDVARVIEAARETGAALLGSPARDTIKRVRGGVVVETPDRNECWAAETPQVFRVELLREALAKARADGVVGTDDAQLVERLGVAVRMVESLAPNPKITLPGDLAAAEAWLSGAGR
jgi:2-C-methyl-D-erythritol 4-phosphate cytidylyltransferase